MTELICKSCGKTIQVPEELEMFSCVYCGEKMTREELTAPMQVSEEQDRDFAREHLIDGIRDNPKYVINNFNKKKYTDTYYHYKHMRSDTYEAMNRYILANPAQREALLEEFVDRFLADWETLHQEKGRKGDSAVLVDKMLLALYEVPAILDMELSCGRDYVDTLHRRFVEKYPKNAFQPGTYEEISAGFRKRKWCFITTAICTFEGKPDDCAELTDFRAFRDGWLSERGDQALIEEYYEIAPVIVNAIDFCDDRAERYAALRRDYLTPCYEALRQGDMEACRSRYISMVRDLERTYGLQ